MESTQKSVKTVIIPQL